MSNTGKVARVISELWSNFELSGDDAALDRERLITAVERCAEALEQLGDQVGEREGLTNPQTSSQLLNVLVDTVSTIGSVPYYVDHNPPLAAIGLATENGQPLLRDAWTATTPPSPPVRRRLDSNGSDPDDRITEGSAPVREDDLPF
jgi:hypothetical protein